MSDTSRLSKPSSSNAVWGHRLCKTYGRGKTSIRVLTSLNISVPYGAIYGLLGPSGCGKTTLLRSMVGLLKLDSGQLSVMGDVPAAKGHCVPGSMVGYMPQELSLYNELTIEELLFFFGRVHGKPMDELKCRCNFLLDFLKLPARTSIVGYLSGGQKRRVSLAAALLHKPGLLILDEPTVGVDPVLRERIWEHLLKIAQSSQKTTIIITTHYIDEARQADKVGLMRAGRMLDEDKPSALMDRYSMLSLDTIFLHLCHHDIVGNAADEEYMLGTFGNSEETAVSFEGKKLLLDNDPSDSPSNSARSSAPNSASSSTYGSVVFEGIPRGKPRGQCCFQPDYPSPRRIGALTIKNLTVLKRSIGLLIFEFCIPAIQVLLFCLCIGRNPHDLKMGIVNLDEGGLGLLYLSHLDNSTLIQVPYKSVNEGRAAVGNGDAWGVLHIQENFTIDLMLRLQMGQDVTTDVINGSTIFLYLDLTSQQLSAMIQAQALRAFLAFSRQTLEASGHNVHYSDPPVTLGDPVFGDSSSLFTDFMAPGICNSITFFMATGLTTLAFVLERRDGNYERNLVNGVLSSEVMVSHVITQFLVLVVQVGLLLICTFTIFKIPLEGSWFTVLCLILMQGLCGMCMGLMISACCEKETSAIQCAMGLIYPLLLTSGIIWPIQAVPKWLMYISDALPLTLPTDALRFIMGRGWGMAHPGVFTGLLITMGWIVVFVFLTAVIARFNR